MSKRGKNWVSNAVLAICTLCFMGSVAYNFIVKKHKQTRFPEIELIDDPYSPIDSIVSGKDSVLYYKDGILVGFGTKNK